MAEPLIRPDLAPIIDLVGEQPDEDLLEEIADASAEAYSRTDPDLTAALGVSGSLAAVVALAAEAALLRRLPAVTAANALELAVSPDGIAFLEEAVAIHQGRVERREARHSGKLVPFGPRKT